MIVGRRARGVVEGAGLHATRRLPRVPSPDRLGWSLEDLISIVAGLRKHGVGFRSLHGGSDTTVAGGRLVFHVFAACRIHPRTDRVGA
ncbi:recombinase family protein [Actinomadura sp. WMMA1423]|uniref:recombinase family protein n=1 Tax=Actinomadura sp. WMMA1423 TaxID=2591108 RepID=UPI001F0F532D|nr:recombinase family protein [Actinomadura sp. WMMA1423]